ncbi:winged helix-turn-helix transcriptional regulator [Serratia nematodiphila]
MSRQPLQTRLFYLRCRRNVLKELESRHLVTCTVFREVPPKVEYALTELGTSLWQAANELNRWVEQNCHFLVKDTDPSL